MGPTKDTVLAVRPDAWAAQCGGERQQGFRLMHQFLTWPHAISQRVSQNAPFQGFQRIHSTGVDWSGSAWILSAWEKWAQQPRNSCGTLFVYDKRCTDSLPWHVCTWHLNLTLTLLFFFSFHFLFYFIFIFPLIITCTTATYIK